jgi:hypothetical protein
MKELVKYSTRIHQPGMVLFSRHPEQETTLIQVIRLMTTLHRSLSKYTRKPSEKFSSSFQLSHNRIQALLQKNLSSDIQSIKILKLFCNDLQIPCNIDELSSIQEIKSTLDISLQRLAALIAEKKVQ